MFISTNLSIIKVVINFYIYLYIYLSLWACYYVQRQIEIEIEKDRDNATFVYFVLFTISPGVCRYRDNLKKQIILRLPTSKLVDL